MRDIRRRIRSVRNTQQITKAMEMVSAAKLRRAEQHARAARPFAERLREVLGQLTAAGASVGREAQGSELDLLVPRPVVRRTGYVLITADRGLAGAYNANVIRKCQELLRATEHEAAVVAVGRKGRDFLRRRGITPLAEYVQLGDNIDWVMARSLARDVMEFYRSGRVDEVYLIYNSFVTTVTHRPVALRLLPVEAPAGDGRQAPTDYLWEPSPEAVLRLLVPRYVETQVYRALLEAKASEHAARMVAMRNASDNAEEMIRTLTLSFNRARQAAITKEIAELVGGAEALMRG